MPLSAAILAQLEREAMATFLSNPRGTESHTGALALRLFFRARLTDPPAYQGSFPLLPSLYLGIVECAESRHRA